MCGIYGTTIRYNKMQIRDKLDRTAFRGPDQTGQESYITENSNITLGHNRLSIIDLDPRSNQPFTYYEKIHIVFNGEIYNFKTLKDKLYTKGYNFNTTSDTEVICAAYLEYGEYCVNHFNGMFAFVIYDEKKHCFFGARDRLGQKPFYYYHKGKEFEFASQISSIQLHNQRLTVSKKSISFYLTWGNIPDPQSIFNEVKKLKAGHSFVYNIHSGSFNTKAYWDIDWKLTHPFKGTYHEAKMEFKNILIDAVQSRLFADVPVGVFLSGGIDSSLISAIATNFSTSKTKTFSVKFNEQDYDESPFAQKIANHLQTDHYIIECDYNEGLDLIENFHYYYDEPFADASAIPSMLLSKHTRKHVTVALSGDGGDESFLGYHRYNWVKKSSWIYSSVPLLIRNASSEILDLFPNYRLKTIAKALRIKNVNEAYLGIMSSIDLSYIKSEFDTRDIIEKKYLYHREKNLYERISDFDIKTYLNWDINTKVDRATMAYSLEARSPLMDHRIVEFARSLPTNFKFEKNNQKRILKDILYEYIPREFFDRPKAGFTMPFQKWFRDDLKEFVLDELNDEGLSTLPCININNVKIRINQHMNGTWNRYPMIWSLLVLKQWLKNNGTGLTIK
ncbi:asparagine synthase (glutamine-hydrolyzing) [Mangrovimonas sp. TPBH4]|uniref:asparagine synthase (glutamine-hydrolyzing) n=1 Tax=Mangrovimonas sp. TPBH4 TaxID=1645914 RepID=UPI0006B6976A|nr:asparagine synthase (glutamine-hydrolyzing) [Mangrovimonas sp. TPBH4]